MIGKENYETGSLLDYAYYKKEYKLVACDLSKQKIFDTNRGTSQQIEIILKLDNTNAAGNPADKTAQISASKRQRNKIGIQ